MSFENKPRVFALQRMDASNCKSTKTGYQKLDEKTKLLPFRFETEDTSSRKMQTISKSKYKTKKQNVL